MALLSVVLAALAVMKDTYAAQADDEAAFADSFAESSEDYVLLERMADELLAEVAPDAKLSCARIIKGVDIVGSNLGVANVGTIGACCAACGKRRKCRSAVWQSENQRCYFKWRLPNAAELASAEENSDGDGGAAAAAATVVIVPHAAGASATGSPSRVATKAGSWLDDAEVDFSSLLGMNGISLRTDHSGDGRVTPSVIGSQFAPSQPFEMDEPPSPPAALRKERGSDPLPLPAWRTSGASNVEPQLGSARPTPLNDIVEPNKETPAEVGYPLVLASGGGVDEEKYRARAVASSATQGVLTASQSMADDNDADDTDHNNAQNEQNEVRFVDSIFLQRTKQLQMQRDALADVKKRLHRTWNEEEEAGSGSGSTALLVEQMPAAGQFSTYWIYRGMSGGIGVRAGPEYPGDRTGDAVDNNEEVVVVERLTKTVDGAELTFLKLWVHPDDAFDVERSGGWVFDQTPSGKVCMELVREVRNAATPASVYSDDEGRGEAVVDPAPTLDEEALWRERAYAAATLPPTTVTTTTSIIQQSEGSLRGHPAGEYERAEVQRLEEEREQATASHSNGDGNHGIDSDDSYSDLYGDGGWRGEHIPDLADELHAQELKIMSRATSRRDWLGNIEDIVRKGELL